MTTRNRATNLLAAVCGVSALACAGAQLEPAPEAYEIPGVGLGAADRVADVRVEARVDAWVGRPRQLAEEVTPVLVRLENESSRELRVRFDDFSLADDAGRSYGALPPFEIDAESAEPIRGYTPSLLGFRVAPYLEPHFPHARVHSGFRHDPDYYGTLQPRLRDRQLPTRDMLAHALPEGVVDPGGAISGFVYFEKIDGRVRGQVDFRFTLVGARTGESFGLAKVPFRVESDGPL